MTHSDKVTWYSDFMKNEMTKLELNKFIGNISFRVDFKDGEIAQISCNMNKSIRMPKEE